MHLSIFTLKHSKLRQCRNTTQLEVCDAGGKHISLLFGQIPQMTIILNSCYHFEHSIRKSQGSMETPERPCNTGHTRKQISLQWPLCLYDLRIQKAPLQTPNLPHRMPGDCLSTSIHKSLPGLGHLICHIVPSIHQRPLRQI